MLRRFLGAVAGFAVLVGVSWAIDVTAKIKEINAERGTLVIAVNGQERAIKVAKDVKVLDKQGKELPDGLKAKGLEGVDVTLTVDKDGNEPVIKAIRLGSKAAPVPDNPKGKTDGPTPFDPQEGPKALVGVKPLTEMTATEKYKDQDGGLYGGGKNEPPEAHQAAAKKQTAEIILRDAQGKPAKNGKIAMISIGMSNTTAQFAHFKEAADKDPKKSPSVVLIDGAQGGCPAFLWVLDGKGRLSAAEQQRLNKDCDSWYGREALQMLKLKAPIWSKVDDRLKGAGVTAEQVQVLWLKQADVYPPHWGAFPAHAQKFQDNLTAILNIAKSRYPNLKVAYLSSRTYGGYSTKALNPEPYAYETAFTVRWLIQEQIKGNPLLNYDPARGEVKAPLLLWGPYLWANGATPRKSDGLVWERNDFMADGVHPNDKIGVPKVVEQLLKFFKSDLNAKTWFLAK
jgi:hypothetical protein